MLRVLKVMQTVPMLSVIMPNVVMLSVAVLMLGVFMPSEVMLLIALLSVIVPSVARNVNECLYAK
jgi:hypothetical protein